MKQISKCPSKKYTTLHILRRTTSMRNLHLKISCKCNLSHFMVIFLPYFMVVLCQSILANYLDITLPRIVNKTTVDKFKVFIKFQNFQICLFDRIINMSKIMLRPARRVHTNTVLQRIALRCSFCFL